MVNNLTKEENITFSGKIFVSHTLTSISNFMVKMNATGESNII